MKYIKHIHRGVLHKTFCEDYLIDEIINEKYRILGVFDGCSSGVDSHFASALLGKTIISVAKSIDFDSDKNSLKEIVFQTVISLKITKNELNLDTNELLSTMIVMLLNTETETADIIAIGDGLLSINKQVTDIDQNNTPDYLAYHLDEINNYKDFKKYYKKQLIFNNIKVEDITISTDGINSFIIGGTNASNEFDIVKFFTEDLYLKDNIAMLSRKCNIIKKKYDLENADDLAIIRVMKNQ